MKRVFDLTVALMLTPFIAVVSLAFAAAFWVSTGESPVFRQKRTGLGNRAFWTFKLRTMKSTCNADGSLLPDNQRITPLGALMRKLSIDELPQVINILCGDMSFVGPRPQDHAFLAKMTESEKRRHNVLPGITGWSQINGRNAVTWTERFRQDLYYVDNASFALDMKIFMMTPLVIVSGKNVSHEGHATMPSLTEERA